MDGDFTEQVFELIDRVPMGRVVTYGAIADAIGRGGARGVGGVMAREGAAVTWWRVVRADGSLPAHLMPEAQQRWLDEGTPVRRGRVDMTTALWRFDA